MSIIDSIQLSGVTYQIQGSGGGKAIEAGRGITITTGETADTVSFNLPISAGTGTNSIAEGYQTQANGNQSHAEGNSTQANGYASHAEGYHTTANNQSEHASGQYNVSSSATTEFGDSGNTLFSVGNGTADDARHNAFEIRQNGNIYITSGGTDILLQDHLGGGGGNPTVELTQAEYDALVSAGTVSADTYYIITDAQAGDLTNYYTKTETNTLLGGKADTATTYTKTEVDNAITAATSTKQDTLVSGTNIKTINNTSILGSGNIEIEGGGKAVAAGTNISVTTGETADTINCTLPMSTDSVKKIVVDSNYSSFVTSDAVFTANSLSNSILLGNNTFKIKGVIKGKINNNLIIGRYNTSQLTNGTSPTLEGNLVVGSNNTINGASSLLVGSNNTISRSYQFAIGYKQHPNNEYETSLGAYSVSSSGSSTFGDSGNTLFSVGNGTAENSRHNAFEIRQNGDIYCSDGTNDVKLQDTITATASNTTALGGLKLVKLSQSEYDSLATKDNSTLYVIVN